MNKYHCHACVNQVNCEKKIFDTWGKSKSNNDDSHSYHPLVYHCLDVAAVGETILDSNPNLLLQLQEMTSISSASLRPLLRFFLAVHDLGKVSGQFQNLDPELYTRLTGKQSHQQYLIHHTNLGKALWDDTWNCLWASEMLPLDGEDADGYDWQIILEPWSLASMGHHGRPPMPEGYWKSNHDDSDKASALLFSFAKLFFTSDSVEGILHYNDDMERGFRNSSWLLAGIMVLSDWIASNEHYFSFIEQEMRLDEYWNTVAVPAAAMAVAALGFIAPKARMGQKIGNLFPFIIDSTPLQKCLTELPLVNSPQLHIIEDLTGSGKTEAALFLAYRLIESDAASGLFFSLPTMATSDAMYNRIMDYYLSLYEENLTPTIQLTHSRRHVSNNSNEADSWLSSSRKRALLSNIGVGTVDQALMAVLPMSHQSLRLLGLARNILIVDEVHAYDPYMHTLLCTLLRFHARLGGSAILLSATLPMRTREELLCSYAEGRGEGGVVASLAPYPLFTSYYKGSLREQTVASNRERHITFSFIHTFDDAISTICTSYTKGRCICWIRNTVDDAIDAYTAVKHALPDAHIILFHARYAFVDRRKIQEEVIRRFGKDGTPEMRRGTVLIATQVVEQSLDLDFDDMITDLAPIDLLLQRAGRLQRHEAFHKKDEAAVLVVFAPHFDEMPNEAWYASVFPRGAAVYPQHGRLWKTMEFLYNSPQVTLPKSARAAIEYVYGKDVDVPELLVKRDLRAEGECKADIALAHLNCLNVDTGYVSDMHWSDEALTPTRIHDPSVTLRLAVNTSSGKIGPWADALWEDTEIQVRARLVNQCIDDETHSTARSMMPDQGKWCIPVVLHKNGDAWLGRALDKGGNLVSIEYDAIIGLRLHKLER